MIIAIASGKGGTGKTTVAASLAHVWPDPVVAMDLDVEAPNLHLFLHPEETGRQKAVIEIPVADESKCTYCRKCSDLCQFAAVKVLGEVLMVFPEMCHGCGGCLAICPEGALTPGERELGDIIWGKAGRADFIMGRSRVGEAMSPPLMRQVKAKLADIAPAGVDVIIDAPPGVSCPAVNAVMDADAIVLVTEPTPFGVFDLGLAHKAFAPMGKPMGVVVNRAGVGTDEVYRFCRRNGLDIFAEIPYDLAIAEAYAEGHVVAEAVPSAGEILTALAQRLRRLVNEHGAKEASRV
jgi:MinD superfamily P-loop ATPase